MICFKDKTVNNHPTQTVNHPFLNKRFAPTDDLNKGNEKNSAPGLGALPSKKLLISYLRIKGRKICLGVTLIVTMAVSLNSPFNINIELS